MRVRAARQAGRLLERLLSTKPADLANSDRLAWKYVIKNGKVWEVSGKEEVDTIVRSR